MRLLAGLGNPGRGYAHNRHNIGFLAADEIHRHYRLGPWRARFQGLVSEGEIGPERVVVLKPETYMNESGRSVAAAARFYKLAPPAIIVIHDEVDLAAGRIRVKQGGGAGGHNGLRSIDAHLGPDYWRVRIGVGHPGHADLVRPYVLQDFAKEERPLMSKVVVAAVEALPLLLAGDANGFMNKVVVAMSPPKPKTKPEGKDEAGDA
ncbi:MAG TPA: aminoacyl-tRNA hydrolase [Candidatus Udaeobacter sp.]|nr:aminoacyl-tRNA hydrolase [Candidatus Udaeobacter sp.]